MRQNEMVDSFVGFEPLPLEPFFDAIRDKNHSNTTRRMIQSVISVKAYLP